MVNSPDDEALTEVRFSLNYDGYRKTRRMLKRRMKTASQGWLEATQNPSIKARFSEMRKVGRKCESIAVLLDITESSELLSKAERLNLELPREKTDWWYPEDSLKAGEFAGDVLTQKGQNRVRKLIKEEQRRNLEWWIKVLSPILALIVSGLGLILALTSIARR